MGGALRESTRFWGASLLRLGYALVSGDRRLMAAVQGRRPVLTVAELVVLLT